MSREAVLDSEEEDSDYVQDEAAGDEEEEEDDLGEPEEALGTGISAKNRSKIDDLWASMNAEDAPPPGGAAGSSRDTGSGKSKGKKAKKKANKKANQVLAGIFGKKAASGIVSGASNAKRRGEGGGSEAAKRKKVLASSRKVEVTEVKKYAGKDILVKRAVTAGSAEHAAVAAKQKKGGLDNILAAIDGPKTISTVTKSSMDWETYKTAEGIEGDMQQATKDGKGFLNKQDFLQRCDVRKFESELESRQAKRDT